MNVEKYDLAIIGSGSGNSVVTPYWNDKSVVIIDSGIFGGTCLNVGCIPTKMFAYPAMQAASTTHAKRLGVDLEFHGADWEEIRDRVFGRIDAISEAGKHYRDVELENTTLVAEEVRFTGPKQLTSETGRVIEADNIVIAAGSRAMRPEIPGVYLPEVHTSDTIMRLEKLPESLVIVGGGYIAAEFAAVFSGFGVDVTQVVRKDLLLREHDQTVSERFTEQAKKRWKVLNNLAPAEIRTSESGQLEVLFHPNGDDSAESSASTSIETDLVLIATGREPNGDRLNLKAAGFDSTEDNRVVTDEYLRVLANGEVVDGVWALGDITNKQRLKHVANHEQRVVSHNMENPDDLRANTLGPIPAAVFTQPQIAAVGLTESEAEKEYGADNISVKIQSYGDVAYGWAMEDDHGFVKLIAEKATGKILGAHLMGEESSILIQPLIQAMSFGLDAHQMARGQYWAHPALTEVVENALLGLDVPDSGKL